MNRKLLVALAILAAAALPAFAGEYHSGNNLECYDCHTPHHSMQHNWDGTTPVPTTVAPNGNWMGATGPNAFLLKLPANELCMACHDGQTFAPDVVGQNANTSPSQGRNAGAINEDNNSVPGYSNWMGHSLASTAPPPGYNPAVVGAPATWYDAAGGLECISCHAQHGPATSYRNLGSYALGGAAANARPTYVISTTDNTTKDVWINLASYTAGSGSAATFNPYYDFANISYNRNDATVGTTKTSNRMDTFCATCHGDFHGGAGDPNIGATIAALDGFLRHPTSQVTIGAAGAQGYGGHSSLANYVAGQYKVRVYASDQTAFTDASPGCVSCHKAHGNKNPFGLFFLAQVTPPRTAAGPVTEDGVYETGQPLDTATGQRNLCGQCHGQGND
jgi:hypothetical protein